MKIYAFRKNIEKKNNSVVLEMTKDDFMRLQSKLFRYVLLNNFENAKRSEGIYKTKNIYIENIFKAIALFFKNNKNLEYFNKDESRKFVIINCDDKVLELYRKYFIVIFKIFDNNVNVNKIIYDDNACVYEVDII